MTREEIQNATNILAARIVNSQEVHDLIHKQVCSDLKLNPDVDLSAKFEENEELESLYYKTGARYWASLAHGAANQLDPILDPKD